MAKKKQRRQPSTGLVRVGAAVVQQASGEPVGELGVFERMARDPKLTPEKLEKLIELKERIDAAEAKRAFEAAFALMQPEIPRIAKRGAIKNKQGGVQSRYSKYEDIRAVVDPILKRHGFHVHSRTEWPDGRTAEVVGMLTHHRGHTRESRFRSQADGSGGKNEIQGLGSAVSYGKRYTLIDLLGIVCEGVDDDGVSYKAPSPRAPEPAPKAYVTGSEGKPITVQMRDRLVKLVERSGRDPHVFKRWLAHRYGWESTKEIIMRQYEEICAAVEAPGELTMREPGAEG